MNRFSFIFLVMFLTMSSHSFGDEKSSHYFEDKNGDYGQHFKKSMCEYDGNLVRAGYPASADPNYDFVYFKPELRSKMLTSKHFIEVWQKHFTTLHKKIPHPSPSEIEWLKAELASKDYNRLMTASDSIENSKYLVSEWTHKALALIKAAQTSTGVFRNRLLVRFANHLYSMPIEGFYDLRSQGYLSDLVKSGDGLDNLGYEEGFIPDGKYRFLYGNFDQEYQQVLFFVSSCLIIQ